MLRDGDELALIPPVAGGAPCRHVELTDRTLSLDRCIDAVRGDGMGGIATFTGMVRLHSRGTTIDHLEYEAYAPMAIKVMTELCDEIEAGSRARASPSSTASAGSASATSPS